MKPGSHRGLISFGELVCLFLFVVWYFVLSASCLECISTKLKLRVMLSVLVLVGILTCLVGVVLNDECLGEVGCDCLSDCSEYVDRYSCSHYLHTFIFCVGIFLYVTLMVLHYFMPISFTARLKRGKKE